MRFVHREATQAVGGVGGGQYVDELLCVQGIECNYLFIYSLHSRT